MYDLVVTYVEIYLNTSESVVFWQLYNISTEYQNCVSSKTFAHYLVLFNTFQVFQRIINIIKPIVDMSQLMHVSNTLDAFMWGA